MINLVGMERAIKKAHQLSLIGSMFFLLFYTGGCLSMSQSIIVSNLDDTIESFACHAAEGAHRAGAKIIEAELKVNVATAYDIEAGTVIPVALPVTAKGKAQFQEGTTLTIKLNLDNVKYKGIEDTNNVSPEIRIYKMNTETRKIQKNISSS